MGKVIAYINEKGGVGKSSVCFNVAWCMAEEGRNVLMIDLDGQRANLTYIAGIDKPSGLSTMYDVLTAGLDIRRAVLIVEEHLHIVPATADVVALDQKNNRLEDMKKAVDELRPYYDYIFLDVSPTPNRGHALALAAADGVVIPMLPDITSLEANKGVVESIRITQREMNPDLQVLGIVFNKYTLRSLLSRQVTATAEKMAAALQSRVFETRIRQAVVLSENVGRHIGITAYAPKSNCVKDIRHLCKEIEEAANHVQ
ncbi:MAG: ParA family protein [Faecousia sp.]